MSISRGIWPRVLRSSKVEQISLLLTSGQGRRLSRILLTSRCIYCRAPATTRDHTPPKLLLRKPYPSNYRTVPSCERCNASWSLDEEYLRVVLSLVGFTPELQQESKAEGYMDRLLAAKPFLDDRITASLRPDDAGPVYLRPEVKRLASIATKMACGLYALRYGVGRQLSDFSAGLIQHAHMPLPPAIHSAMLYWPGIKRKRWTTVQPGTFEFLFANSWLNEGPPAWCLLNLHDTIIAAVGCPPLAKGRKEHRLKARPW
jgi:hypothetical protein